MITRQELLKVTSRAKAKKKKEEEEKIKERNKRIKEKAEDILKELPDKARAAALKGETELHIMSYEFNESREQHEIYDLVAEKISKIFQKEIVNNFRTSNSLMLYLRWGEETDKDEG